MTCIQSVLTVRDLLFNQDFVVHSIEKHHIVKVTAIAACIILLCSTCIFCHMFYFQLNCLNVLSCFSLNSNHNCFNCHEKWPTREIQKYLFPYFSQEKLKLTSIFAIVKDLFCVVWEASKILHILSSPQIRNGERYVLNVVYLYLNLF